MVFAVCGWIWVDAILDALGTPADALPLARSYLRIIFLAVPMMNLLSFVMTVLRGAGDSRTPFLFMALAVVLDVFLNPLLILGIGPFPELGIAGSATSTLIGQTVSVVAILIVLYARKHPLRLAGANLALLQPDPALLRIVVFKGVPMGLQMIVVSAAALTVMGMVNSYGSQVAAAYGIAAQLWTYIQMPALAIGAAVSSMAAQNVGAGRWDRIGRIATSGVGFNLVLTGVLVALLFVFDRAVLSLFLGSDSAAIDIATHINKIASWSFILFGITIVLFATVRCHRRGDAAADHPGDLGASGAHQLRLFLPKRDRRGSAVVELSGWLDNLARAGRGLLSLRPLAQPAHDREPAGCRRTAGYRPRRAASARTSFARDAERLKGRLSARISHRTRAPPEKRQQSCRQRPGSPRSRSPRSTGCRCR